MKILASTKNNNNNSNNNTAANIESQSPTAVCDNASAKIHPQAETVYKYLI